MSRAGGVWPGAPARAHSRGGRSGSGWGGGAGGGGGETVTEGQRLGNRTGLSAKYDSEVFVYALMSNLSTSRERTVTTGTQYLL